MSGLGFDPGFSITGGQGAWLHSADGRRILDGLAGDGICNLGRRPAAVVDALTAALDETDQGNFPMISREKADLAAALAAWAPVDLDAALFSVMRGEALDAALKIARGSTGRATLVSASGAWYGETGFALSLSDRPDRDLYGPLIPQTRLVPFGDLAGAQAELDRGAAAFVIEPIQAEHHAREAEPGYLQGLRDLCDRTGALLVLDETWTGFGRTGHRLACSRAGVVPDILVLGEALGAGVFPIAATLLSRKVNRFMEAHPLIHLSTFGGSDLGCRTALAALETYEQERAWDRAAQAGARLREGLEMIRSRRPGVAPTVAGRGLLLSLDMGTTDRAKAFCRAAAGAGLLVRPERLIPRGVLLAPSLLVTDDEVSQILTAIDTALVALENA